MTSIIKVVLADINMCECKIDAEYRMPYFIPSIRTHKPQPINFGLVFGYVPSADVYPVEYSEYKFVGVLPDGRYFYALDKK